MGALVTAMREGRVSADPAVVISNVPGAPGLDAAAGYGVATAVVYGVMVFVASLPGAAVLAAAWVSRTRSTRWLGAADA